MLETLFPNGRVKAVVLYVRDGNDSIPWDGSVTADINNVVVHEFSTVSTTSSVASSATVVDLLASNANRLGAMIHNDSTQNLYLKLGDAASLTDFTIRMASQSYFELPYGYVGKLTGLWASANGSARITELT